MTWTMREIQARVEEALYIEPARGANGRVTEIPNARTIRYYTTQQMVDKPKLEGGQAHYERRHLLQILAIKRLQAEGKSLTTIREGLHGAGNRSLSKIAKIPKSDRLAKARKALDRHRRNFWAAPAAPACTSSTKPLAFAVLRGLELQDGTYLTFKTHRDLFPEDVEAINAAAESLLKTLRKRGLTK